MLVCIIPWVEAYGVIGFIGIAEKMNGDYRILLEFAFWVQGLYEVLLVEIKSDCSSKP